MSGVRKSLGKSPPSQRWAAALVLTAVALVACGGGNGDEGDASGTTARPTIERDSREDREPILIETRVTFGKVIKGEVLRRSTIGDRDFCPDGTFRDRHGNDDIGSVDRTYRCADGSLRMGFTPGHPRGGTQTGPWKILSGTGAFEGLRGRGRMKVRFSGNDEGRERFTGTVRQ